MRTPAPHQYSILDVARAFSVAAHCAVNQKRKYSGEDYFHHPEEVLQLLLTYDDPTLEMQVAALLHDVVEDTAVELTQIRRIFGKDIAKLVSELTEVSRPADGNRAQRKALDLEHLKRASRSGMLIKCADLISNSRTIVKFDETFAKVYLVEKLAMLKAMESSVGVTDIWYEALAVCLRGITKLWPEREEQYAIIYNAGFVTLSFDQFIEYMEQLS